jgi:hypothetical protein
MTAWDHLFCRNQNNSEGDTPVKDYAIVPYIQGVTEPIKRILSNCNIKVALKPYLTLGHIFAKPKDSVKTNQKTHAVYSISCGDCEKEYLAQSKHQFGTRQKEHQKAVSTLDKGKSALAEHVLLFPVNFETTFFLGGLSVTVLSITKDIFVYLVITIRCKRRVKNCKFQFDS